MKTHFIIGGKEAETLLQGLVLFIVIETIWSAVTI